MVDPRHEHHDNGTHPRDPNVGGPTPDPRLGNPPPIKWRNRIMIGVAIGTLALIAVVFLIWYWMTGEDAGADLSDPQPTATAAVKPAAQPGDCRPFEKVMEVQGKTRTLTGTACMQADGTWRIVAPE